MDDAITGTVQSIQGGFNMETILAIGVLFLVVVAVVWLLVMSIRWAYKRFRRASPASQAQAQAQIPPWAVAFNQQTEKETEVQAQALSKDIEQARETLVKLEEAARRARSEWNEKLNASPLNQAAIDTARNALEASERMVRDQRAHIEALLRQGRLLYPSFIR